MTKKIDRKKVNIIYDSDISDFLKSLNLYEDVVGGKKVCKFTGEIITLNNFYSIFKEGGDIKLVSDSPEAVRLFSEFLNSK